MVPHALLDCGVRTSSAWINACAGLWTALRCHHSSLALAVCSPRRMSRRSNRQTREARPRCLSLNTRRPAPDLLQHGTLRQDGRQRRRPTAPSSVRSTYPWPIAIVRGRATALRTAMHGSDSGRAARSRTRGEQRLCLDSSTLSALSQLKSGRLGILSSIAARRSAAASLNGRLGRRGQNEASTPFAPTLGSTPRNDHRQAAESVRRDRGQKKSCRTRLGWYGSGNS